MSEALNLGKIIKTKQERDAIHIAIVPVICGADYLAPGEKVKIDPRNKWAYPAKQSKKVVGVVDPFLKGNVLCGDVFWLFLIPGSITSLRHEWTHPEFDLANDPEPSLEESRAFVTKIARVCNQTYDSMMKAASYWVTNKEYTQENSQSYDSVREEEWAEFWEHYELLSKQRVSIDDRHSFFSCSC